MIVLPANGSCPVCLSKIHYSTTEVHPSRSDLAIQNFECPKCNRVVKSIVISLKPRGK